MKETQPEYIVIGKINSPWGFDGNFSVDVETDFPQRYSSGSTVYIDREMVVIDTVNWNKGRAIIKIDGLETEEDAEKLSGKLIEIHRSQLFELKEDEYYHFQLIGMKVQTTAGEMIGEITEILRMSSADVYVVSGSNGEILLPATEDVIKSVDVEGGVLVIEPVEGLLELNEKKKK